MDKTSDNFQEESGTDGFYGTGVFLVGKDVVMDNVVIGSLVGDNVNNNDVEANEEDLLARAELLKDDDDDFFSHLDITEDEDDTCNQEFLPKVVSKGARKKFQMRIRAKAKAKSSKPYEVKTAKSQRVQTRKTVAKPAPKGKDHKDVSASTTERKKLMASETSKVHREKRNVSIDKLRSIIPGVGAKLNLANVLEMAVNYILFLKKHTDTSDIDAGYLASLTGED